MRFKEWFDDYPKLEVLPWERHGKQRFGNELKDTATGGKILGSPFHKKEEPLVDWPVSSPQKPGLGELGMREIGRTTFKPEPIPAGETPVLSRGIPV